MSPLMSTSRSVRMVCSNPEHGGGGGLSNEGVGKLIHINMDKSVHEPSELLCRRA